MKPIKAKIPANYEELIRHRYGDTGAKRLRSLGQVDELVQSYYGKPRALKKRKQKAKPKPKPVLSQSFDDGETLIQAPAEEIPSDFEEYVVQGRVMAYSEAQTYQEYVVGAMSATAGEAPVEESSPYEEYLVAGRLPPEAAPAPTAAPPPEAAAPPPPDAAPQAPAQTAPAAPAQPGPAQPAPQNGEPPQAAPTTPADEVTEDDFLADFQAILNGQKVYDPEQKKTVDRGQATGKPGASGPPPGVERPLPRSENEQAIFDRIAQSMQYANAFDLGTVELENRFALFDRELEEKLGSPGKARKPKGKKAGTPAGTPVGAPAAAAKTGASAAAPEAQEPAGPTVGSADFLQDLDAIQEQRRASAPPPAPAQAQAASTRYSRPFYDTGEHVQAGKDLYEGRLRVGKPPGVLFSYGQLVAMADLYESVDQMMDASAAELERVKALIERSTQYYLSRKSGAVRDVSSEEWEQATQNRYLRLAEDNYEHFSPNLLFKDSPVAKAADRFGDNRSAWERHHQRAIEEAQKILLDPANADRSVFLEWPLIINAFGDHFLTDAFASGHLINKEVMIALFKANFFDGAALKPEAKAFFEKVAKMAWKGELSKRFSALETADYPVCKWGWCIKWHPNINSPDRFSQVLIGAAEQQPDRIANFAVKALHDRLNKEGIEVTNQAGDGTWKLFGDAYMDGRTLAIIQKAVQQSVDNLHDPAIKVSNVNLGPFFSTVWKFVPQPTAASRSKLEQLMNEYSRPSDALANAATEILHKELDALIKTLIRENKLKPA